MTFSISYRRKSVRQQRSKVIIPMRLITVIIMHLSKRRQKEKVIRARDAKGFETAHPETSVIT